MIKILEEKECIRRSWKNIMLDSASYFSFNRIRNWSVFLNSYRFQIESIFFRNKDIEKKEIYWLV